MDDLEGVKDVRITLIVDVDDDTPRFEQTINGKILVSWSVLQIGTLIADDIRAAVVPGWKDPDE